MVKPKIAVTMGDPAVRALQEMDYDVAGPYRGEVFAGLCSS